MCVRRKNRKIGCPPDTVTLAMSSKMKDIQIYFENFISLHCPYCLRRICDLLLCS